MHNFLQKNKHPLAHLQRPNDVQTNAKAFHYPVAVFLFLGIIAQSVPKGNAH